MSSSDEESDLERIVRDLSSELDRLRIALESKRTSLESKGATLIAGAGILVGLLAGRPDGFIKGAACVALLAAAMGVVCLWPRVGREVAIDGDKPEWSQLSGAEVEYRLLSAKRVAHDEDVDRLATLGVWVRFGFSLLAVSIGLVVLSILTR